MNIKSLPAAKLDEIMVANQALAELRTQNPDIINTTIGVISDPKTGGIWRPETVQTAMSEALEMIDSEGLYGYQSQAGHAGFLDQASELLFGADVSDVLGYQVSGGTRALSLARDALVELVDRPEGEKIRMMVDTGWPNYANIFKRDFEMFTYDHQDYDSGSYNHAATMEAITEAGEHAVLLLQAAGYNNDGLSRSSEQWEEILDLAKEQQNIVILDSAYLGLGQGLQQDIVPIRMAVERGLLVFECFSTSKIMGLYGERLGGMFVVNAETLLGQEQAQRADTAIKKLVRGTESSTSRLIAETGYRALKNPKFFEEIEAARQRIVRNREILAEKLGNVFPQIAAGEGLFVKLRKDGFSQEEIKMLGEDGVHVLPSSRINLAGFDDTQAAHVATSLAKVCS